MHVGWLAMYPHTLRKGARTEAQAVRRKEQIQIRGYDLVHDAPARGERLCLEARVDLKKLGRANNVCDAQKGDWAARTEVSSG